MRASGRPFLLVVFSVVALVILIGSLFWVFRWRTAVEVTVINESSQAINDLHITHRFAGLAYIPTLGSGEQVTRRLFPSRGSNIRVSYHRGRSELEVAEADVYVGAMQLDAVTIRITDEGIASASEQKPYWKKKGGKRDIAED